LKSYLNSARKVYAEAEASDDLRDAYVGFCKYANLMSVALTHPGELVSCQTEAVHDAWRDRIPDGQEGAKQGFLRLSRVASGSFMLSLLSEAQLVNRNGFPSGKS
jgi:hypothetical protein